MHCIYAILNINLHICRKKLKIKLDKNRIIVYDIKADFQEIIS